MTRLLPLLLTACLADIRPEGLAEVTTPSEASARAARETIERGVQAAGGWEAWRALDASTLRAEDHWKGVYGLFSPWPSARQELEMTLWHGTMDSRVQFANGRQEGWMWGINDGQTWRAKPGKGTEPKPSKAMAFMLPTLHYFVDFPWRVAEAELVAPAGQQIIDGTAYEAVYATWGSMEPSTELDQYLLFYAPESGRLERASFTVRESSKALVGSIWFRDHRDVRGVQLPHDLIITLQPEGASESRYVHRVRIEGFTAP